MNKNGLDGVDDYSQDNDENKNEYSKISTRKHNIESYFYPMMQLPG